jgi:hypothetical protein
MSEIETKLSQEVFVVEATSYERHALWAKHNETVDWKAEGVGHGCKIGELDGRPVFVAFNYAKINGQLVVFYNPTSQVVDWEMVEKWIKEHFKIGFRDGQSDAMNFGHCLNAIERANGKQL